VAKPVLLGRIERKNLRDIWEREDTEFTPWLALPENLKLLAETLRLDNLELEATEREVGRFSADIVARDASGLVLIENQIEPTDHKHLGQILTYLAGIEDAAIVVWIAQAFLEEDRAAIDWLNANTIDRFEFFGIELEVLQIGASPPAPNFNVVAKPNDWSRTVSRVGESTPKNALRQLYLEYWSAFASYLKGNEKLSKVPKPSSQQWMSFGIGRANFYLNTTFQREQSRIRVELLPADPGKMAFKKLLQQRAEIEQEIASTLTWDELSGKKSSRIAIYRENTDISDKASWPDQFRWYAQWLEDFRRVFTPRIRTLDLEGEDIESDRDGSQGP
jgi:hypothetical protein